MTQARQNRTYKMVAAKWYWIVLLAIVVVHSLLLLKITFFPNSEVFIYPYLTNQGLLPYKQILDQHFPGLMFLPINFDNLGMNTPQTAQLWQIGVVAISHLMLYWLGTTLFNKKSYALLVNLAFLSFQPLFEGYIQWLDVFLPIFTLSACTLFIKALKSANMRTFFAAGIILGAGIVFKQVLIPLTAVLGLYILFATRKEKPLFYFLGGLAIPIGLLFLYLIARGILIDFWYWTVIYNITVFAQYGKNWAPTASHVLRVFFVFLPALFFLVTKIRERSTQVVLIFLVGSLAAVFARFDFIHLQPALPFVLVGLVGFIQEKRIPRLVALVTVCIYVVGALAWNVAFYTKHWGGQYMYFDNKITEVAQIVGSMVPPGSTIFVYGAPTHLYQMTKTIPAGGVFVFQFPWFMSVAGQRVYNGITEDKPILVVAQRNVVVDGAKLVDYTPEIDFYIKSHYKLVRSVDDIDILVRR